MYSRGDAFVSLPTGAGKSLCFMVLPSLPVRLVEVPSVEELAAEEQVGKHCKRQRLPSFPRVKLKNHLPLVVGDGKIEMKLPQRCCEAFFEYLRRAGTELNLKHGISII